MTITSRKPKVEEKPKPVERGFIYIQLQDGGPSQAKKEAQKQYENCLSQKHH
jgi:hypothetical protein